MRISDWSSDVCSSDLLAICERMARLVISCAKAYLMRFSVPYPAALSFENGKMWSFSNAYILPRGRASFMPVVKHVADRKRVVSGKSVSVRVDRGGRRSIQKKTQKN